EEKLLFGKQRARDGDDGDIRRYRAGSCLHSQSPSAAIDQPYRLAKHDRQAGTMGGDHRPVALDHPPVYATVVIAADISRRDPLKLRPIRIGADRVDQGIPRTERLEKCRRRNVRLFLARGMELFAEFLQRLQKVRLL